MWPRGVALFALPLTLGWGCFGERDQSAPSGTAGASGAPNASCLDANVVDKGDCSSDELGLACDIGAACCRCVIASPCDSQWACVEPGLLVDGCPAEPPVSGTSCDTESLSCQYCTDDGPVVLLCTAVRGVDPVEFAWSEGPLGSCSE